MRATSKNSAKDKAEGAGVVEHYPWECISLYRANYLSTLDFVIRDYRAMMAFCLVLHIKVHLGATLDIAKVLLYYKKMKF